jgi:hypothetical protein
MIGKELFKARCTKGHIVIYADKVSIELKTMGVDNSETLRRAQITGIDVKTVFASFMGRGGSANVTINSTGGKSLVAKMVKQKDAKRIKELLS